MEIQRKLFKYLDSVRHLLLIEVPELYKFTQV